MYPEDTAAPRHLRKRHKLPLRLPSRRTRKLRARRRRAAQSLGEEKWWEVFQDKQLQDLIRTALKNNYDVNIAAARILKAQAQLGITRADQLPTLSA